MNENGLWKKDIPPTDLSRMYGIQYYSPVPRSSSSTGSRATISSLDSPLSFTYDGPQTVITFLTANRKKSHDGYPKEKLKFFLEHNQGIYDGLLLDTREKSGVIYPIVHTADLSEHQSLAGIAQENVLGDDYNIFQGIYQEVRNIIPETELPIVAPIPQLQQQHIGYILLGFKSLDRNFSQVMVDTWKDWTGARYIYMYLPDDLGLRKIRFFHKQYPENLNLFMYVVLVECHGINSKEKQIRLLDFVQRMRLERMKGYISVYTGEKLKAEEADSQWMKKSELVNHLIPNGVTRSSRI